MAHNQPLSSSGGPRDHRGRVRFRLLHEHGDFVLHAQEERVQKVHAQPLGRLSRCSVLWITSYGHVKDVGLRLRRPGELLQLHVAETEGVPLLSLVEAALQRDASQRDEMHLLEILEGYRRVVSWLTYHPAVLVPFETLRALHH